MSDITIAFIQNDLETINCLRKDPKYLATSEDEWEFWKACTSGNLHELRRLLALGGDRRINVHARNEVALAKACYYRQFKTVRILLNLSGERKITNLNLPFQLACAGGDAIMVSLLLNKGTSPEYTLDISADGERALCTACQFGHIGVFRLLTGPATHRKKKVDIHYDRDTPFYKACVGGHSKLVEHMLELTGKDRIVNPQILLDSLEYACFSDLLDVARVLLGIKDDRRIDTSSDNHEIFKQACWKSPRILDALMESGKDRIPPMEIYMDYYKGAKKYEEWGE